MIIRTPFYFKSLESAQNVITPETLSLLSTNPQTQITHPLINFTLQTSPLDKPLYSIKTQKLKHKTTGHQIQIIKQICMIQERSEFTKMADFLYTPPMNDQQILKVLGNHLKQGKIELQQKMIECIYPTFYLKSFNLKPPQIDMFQVKVKDIEPRKIGISITFGTHIPAKYYEDVPQNIKNSKLYEVLVSFYQKRPIFLKNVLFNQLKVNGISCTIYKLRSTLAYITYYYKDGPWKNCHIRFGYNPFHQHQSIIYQVIVIKIRSKQIEEFETNTKPSQLYDPTFTHTNTHRNYSSYQLCDLDENIKDIVSSSLNRKQKLIDRNYGWLTKQEYKKIFRIMKRKVLE